mmetsp:Transcript_127201/g.407031  ORF Transcript_127201/g.407031 Transcript_127201/m.407031 type:complete len:687 (+) Transcript_127201:325-2385(+)
MPFAQPVELLLRGPGVLQSLPLPRVCESDLLLGGCTLLPESFHLLLLPLHGLVLLLDELVGRATCVLQHSPQVARLALGLLPSALHVEVALAEVVELLLMLLPLALLLLGLLDGGLQVRGLVPRRVQRLLRGLLLVHQPSNRGSVLPLQLLPLLPHLRLSGALRFRQLPPQGCGLGLGLGLLELGHFGELLDLPEVLSVHGLQDVLLLRQGVVCGLLGLFQDGAKLLNARLGGGALLFRLRVAFLESLELGGRRGVLQSLLHLLVGEFLHRALRLRELDPELLRFVLRLLPALGLDVPRLAHRGDLLVAAGVAGLDRPESLRRALRRLLREGQLASQRANLLFRLLFGGRVQGLALLQNPELRLHVVLQRPLLLDGLLCIGEPLLQRQRPSKRCHESSNQLRHLLVHHGFVLLDRVHCPPELHGTPAVDDHLLPIRQHLLRELHGVLENGLRRRIARRAAGGERGLQFLDPVCSRPRFLACDLDLVLELLDLRVLGPALLDNRLQLSDSLCPVNRSTESGSHSRLQLSDPRALGPLIFRRRRGSSAGGLGAAGPECGLRGRQRSAGARGLGTPCTLGGGAAGSGYLPQLRCEGRGLRNARQPQRHRRRKPRHHRDTRALCGDPGASQQHRVLRLAGAGADEQEAAHDGDVQGPPKLVAGLPEHQLWHLHPSGAILRRLHGCLGAAA